MHKRQLASSKSPAIQIEYGLAYEFLMTLIVFAEDKGYDYEVGQEWFDAVHAAATPELLTAVKLIPSDCNHGWKHLLGLVIESEPPRDVPAFLSYLESIDPLELRLHLMGYYRREFRRLTPLDILLQAAEGDLHAQQQVLATSFPDDGNWQALIRHVFSLGPQELKASILATLSQWYEQVFRDYEQQWLPILARDTESKQAMQETMTPEQLIETATNGLAFVPEPGIRRVLLIPSFVQRPWNELSEYQDIKIFCYPVADENTSEDSSTPPARLVRTYKALADERRLRVLKLLMQKSYTLQEMADEFGVAKTTMHHHLATLRTAGLVRVQSDDKLYSIRLNMLSNVSEMLSKYLKGKTL